MQPESTHLGNWREAPYNRRSFHHVRELIPTANIRHDPAATSTLERNLVDLGGWKMLLSDAGPPRPIDDIFTRSWTDAVLVLRKGVVVFEWFAPHYDGIDPHILFSVSKSLTGALAGVVVELGHLDVDEHVAAYIPDASGSAYGDCTVRNVLDMQVGIDFAEIYTGGNEQFNRYRIATGWNPVTAGGSASDLRSFLTTICHSTIPHGTVFQYASPNTDMLGLILEAVSRDTFSELFSRYIWRPIGAESDAYVTLDNVGAPRAAGGICVRPSDLARFGRMMGRGGRVDGKQVVPADWVADTQNQGSYDAWQSGSMYDLAPRGRYRNQWYQTGNSTGAFFALGIHGQWIYVDPTTDVVIVKLSSQPDPVDDYLDALSLRLFGAFVDRLR